MLYCSLQKLSMGKGNFKQAENYFKLSYEWNFNTGKLSRMRANIDE